MLLHPSWRLMIAKVKKNTHFYTQNCHLSSIICHFPRATLMSFTLSLTQTKVFWGSSETFDKRITDASHCFGYSYVICTWHQMLSRQRGTRVNKAQRSYCATPTHHPAFRGSLCVDIWWPSGKAQGCQKMVTGWYSGARRLLKPRRRRVREAQTDGWLFIMRCLGMAAGEDLQSGPHSEPLFLTHTNTQ